MNLISFDSIRRDLLDFGVLILPPWNPEELFRVKVTMAASTPIGASSLLLIRLSKVFEMEQSFAYQSTAFDVILPPEGTARFLGLDPAHREPGRAI